MYLQYKERDLFHYDNTLPGLLFVEMVATETLLDANTKCSAQGYLWLCLSGHQWGTPMRASWGPLALRKSSITPLRRRCGRTLLCLGLYSHNYTLKLRSHWHRIVSSGGGGLISGSAQAFSRSGWLFSDFHSSLFVLCILKKAGQNLMMTMMRMAQRITALKYPIRWSPLLRDAVAQMVCIHTCINSGLNSPHYF